MNNLQIILIFLLLSITAKAQEKEPKVQKDYTVVMDSLLRFVKKDQIKTGLLYDRVVANANLLEFNNKENKQTSSYWHYIQALSEIHRSSLDEKNKMQYEIVADLRHKKDNVLNISYINTTVDYIDYGTEKEPNLVFKEGYFYNVEDRNPFKQKQVTVIAALAETIFYQDIKIRLNPDMLYQDDSNPIKNLTAIINGTEIKLVANFENIKEITDYKLKGDEKEIVFNIEFKNETKIQTRAALNISLPQVSTPSATTFPLEENFTDNLGIVHNSSENTIPFQGYNETTPIKGVLEYRTYYNTVTNDGSLKSKINKPVIILDGFDPGDKRKIYPNSIGWDSKDGSLYESMAYDHDNDLNTPKKNFVDFTLRPQGFDVTLVNFPENKIVHPTQPTIPYFVVTGTINFPLGISIPVGYWTTVTNYLHLADGGADFIERNAMALVALLKRENKKLADNGSAEKITLIGPSMGGLISRYALAYMEKNNIPHNVKLWVSFDSPHLGANIPIATQAQLLFLGTIGESAEALAKYKENLQSPAARQMLIEQVDNYPNPTSMWSNNSKNNSHPFRQQFLQNQISNSIPNSNGFPTNMRKISLINGTTNGMKTNAEGQLVYDIAVFDTTTNLKGFFNVDRNLSTPGNSVTTFEGRYTKKILCGIPFTNMTYLCGLVITDAWRNDVNINPRGCMDVVPGGTFNTVGIIKKSLDENPAIQENRVENRTYVPHHAFIPTVSSLAFKNPNFDWSTPLNRNLICDPNNKEIPFDSYFSPSNNEEHVALTKESVDWLLNEIQGNVQVPRFDVNESALDGLKLICENQISNYSFGTDVCKLPAAVQSWSVSPNLTINSSNGLNITVQSINGGGAATITADFGNGQPFTKTIWVGVPQFSAFNFNPSGAGTCIAPIDYLIVSLPSLAVTSVFNGQTTSEIQSAANFEWVQENNLIMLNGTKNKRNICPMFEGFSSFKVRAKNSCGWSDWAELPQFEITAPPTYNQRQANTNFYTVYPNPSKDIVNIDLRDANNQPEKNSIICGELFDIMGLQRAKVKIIDNKATFSVQGLNKGIYILKIYLNNQVEAHQIAVE